MERTLPTDPIWELLFSLRLSQVPLQRTRLFTISTSGEIKCSRLPLIPHAGFWFVNGFIDEETVEEKGIGGHERIKCFYNLSGAGGPEREVAAGEHDYFAFPVDYGGRSIAPKSFGGMSGGGLWQVPFTRDADGELKQQAPLLSGVVFYQEVATQTSCNIKCHGPRSVYRFAYKAIGSNEL